jgi:hypothetical protein
LQIVSLANPSAPAIVATLPLGAPFVHDVFVRDGLLFTAEWNNGVGIWDIGGGGTGGTVSQPRLLSRTPTVNGHAHNLWWVKDPVTENARYLLVGEEGPGVVGSSSSGDLHILDISSLVAPREVARYAVSGAGAHNVSVDEDSGFAYVAFYNGGVRVLDIRGVLGDCAASARLADERCDLTLAGRERAFWSGGGGVATPYVWGVHYSTSGVFASDMLNGLLRLTPVVR